jgi:hypothetical protein
VLLCVLISVYNFIIISVPILICQRYSLLVSHFARISILTQFSFTLFAISNLIIACEFRNNGQLIRAHASTHDIEKAARFTALGFLDYAFGCGKRVALQGSSYNLLEKKKRKRAKEGVNLLCSIKHC